MTGRSKRKRIGPAEFALRFPPSLLSRRLDGRLNTPKHDPECEMPPSNSGTVTVEAAIDPAIGQLCGRVGERRAHRWRRAPEPRRAGLRLVVVGAAPLPGRVAGGLARGRDD